MAVEGERTFNKPKPMYQRVVDEGVAKSTPTQEQPQGTVFEIVEIIRASGILKRAPLK